MNTPKYSPIFGPSTKPVDHGWYYVSLNPARLEHVSEGRGHFRFWSGKYWLCITGEPCIIQQFFWRGLAKNPSKN